MKILGTSGPGKYTKPFPFWTFFFYSIYLGTTTKIVLGLVQNLSKFYLKSRGKALAVHYNNS